MSRNRSWGGATERKRRRFQDSGLSFSKEIKLCGSCLKCSNDFRHPENKIQVLHHHLRVPRALSPASPHASLPSPCLHFASVWPSLSSPTYHALLPLRACAHDMPSPDKLLSLPSTWLTHSFSSLRYQHKCPLFVEALPSPQSSSIKPVTVFIVIVGHPLSFTH